MTDTAVSCIALPLLAPAPFSRPLQMSRLHHLLAVLMLISTTQVSAITNDYLPSDLRARVDQLKVSLEQIPTTSINAKVRAELTWQWLNAYALNGGYVPVNATQVIASILGAPQIPQAMIAALDATIKEFAFIDEHPDALGQLEATVGPYIAGSSGTIVQTYTVAEEEVQTGGGFMVARHFMANFGAWQVNYPDQPNFVTITSSNPRVGFVATTAPLSGMHGGFRSARDTLVFKVASGTLKSGDQVMITYGHTEGDNPGMTMPTVSSDRMPLPLYVAFREGGLYYSLPIQPVQIVGAFVEGVVGFAPSIVKPGSAFTLAVRARDRYYNRATGEIPDWKVFKNGELWFELPAETAITTTDITLDAPGAYHLTITDSTGTIAGNVNPILVTDEPRKQIFWGDTHGHSGFAEGIGTPERFMQWARDDARLDFVTHSEHDIWLDDAEWAVLRENVQRFSEEGRFIAYLGYEWTVNTLRGGHHNVLFRNPQDCPRISAQFYPTLSQLYQGLRSHCNPADVVVIPHAHQAGDYRQNDPELEPLIEIMSQHGNFEWFGRLYLKQGHQVGFTAASDNHLSQPGYSAPQGGSLSQRGGLGAVLATQRSANAIFDGMKNLQAYATTGERIIVDFAVNGAEMGQRGSFSQQRNITARVIGTAPIDNVTLFKNDEVLWEKSYQEANEGRLRDSETLLLTFSSASNPYHRNDNPRGWRTWAGTLETDGAKLREIKPIDAGFPLQSVIRPQDHPNRAVFSTMTRGDNSSFLLRLDNLERNARINFDLVETKETGGAPTFYRPAQRIAAESFSLNLKELTSGEVGHVQVVDDYFDRATLRRISAEGPREVEINVTDSSDRHGDYYFIRVLQANDAMAWSSPVWIGGHRKQ